MQQYSNYTVAHKKQDMTYLVITLSIVNQFSQFCTFRKRIIFSTKPI